MISLWLCVALMASAVLALWCDVQFLRLPLWGWGLLGAISTGFMAGLLAPVALLWIFIAVGGCIGWLHLNAYRYWALPFLILYLLAMATGALPGFTRSELIVPEQLGMAALPLALSFGLAKPVAGLLVLALLAPRAQTWQQVGVVMRQWRHWLPPVVAVLLAAILLGVGIDVKFPWWTPLFILCNSLFTVIPEEAFFRGLIQHPLQQHFGRSLWILLVSAVLFAAVHKAPGLVDPLYFYGLMLIAGVAYAWSFRQSGRVEGAIFTHISVNSLHFLLLVYPLSFS